MQCGVHRGVYIAGYKTLWGRFCTDNQSQLRNIGLLRKYNDRLVFKDYVHQSMAIKETFHNLPANVMDSQ